MLKRFLVVALLAGSLGAVGAAGTAQAGCTAENRGGSAGPYDTAGVTFEHGGSTYEVAAWTYGNFATGPISVCSDGTASSSAAAGDFVVTRDGVEVCSSDDPAFRMTADPFGFGASITGTGDGCSVAISFDGITATPGVSPDDVAADSSGANAGVRKNAVVKEHGEGGTNPSSITIGTDTIEIDNGTPGYFTKGARAQSEH